MRITKAQQEEIDYICKNEYSPSLEEQEEYINNTVFGGKKAKGLSRTGSQWQGGGNKIEELKRGLDISVKMWRRDIADGLFAVWEYLEEGEEKGSYPDKILKSIMTSLPKARPGEGIFRTSSILWANERWGLKIEPDTAIEDYRQIKSSIINIRRDGLFPQEY